jgi:hypothetical protein
VLCFEVKGSWRGLIIEDDIDGRQRPPLALTPNIIGRSMVGGTRTKVVVKVVFEIRYNEVVGSGRVGGFEKKQYGKSDEKR